MRHVARGGRYLRLADPGWRDPLSGEHARRSGGRWNPPESFDVVYLNASPDVARAQVRHRLEPRGIRPEDLDPEQGPLLVHADVPKDSYVDATSDRGLAALGITSRFPAPPGVSAALSLSSALRFTRASRLGATIPGVAASPTKRVEFDSELLERLHQRRPEMSDRQLLESVARMTLGRETLRRVQERNTLSEDEAIELGVKAVHEARRERRAAG